MSNTNNSTVDLDKLFDMTLDDLADLPEFLVFPAGAHRVTIDIERKVVNNHPSAELKMKLIETLEMADSTAPVLAAGTESSVLYMMDNEFGQGKFKAMIKPIMAHFATASVLEAIGQSKDLEVVVVTKVRTNKEKAVDYTEIVSLTVL